MRVFVRNGAVWEHFPYSSDPDPYWEYILELEDAAMGEAVQPATVRSSASSTWAVQGEAYEESLPELGSEAAGEGVEGLIERLNNAWATQGEAYFEYMLELENEGMGD